MSLGVAPVEDHPERQDRWLIARPRFDDAITGEYQPPIQYAIGHETAITSQRDERQGLLEFTWPPTSPADRLYRVRQEVHEEDRLFNAVPVNHENSAVCQFPNCGHKLEFVA
jgi:hypothetical protein